MSILRREIHPETRVLDERAGLVEYVASDETVDSYREMIRAEGWRFDQFEKNAAFVDSHDYSTLSKLVGRVVDFKVTGHRLVETVKWAIDVARNELAQLGFEMTKAGYLRAVSVGFAPVQTVSRWDRDAQAYEDACKELGLAPGQCDTIYLEQQQKELSACIIGANPNALAKSYHDGILTDSRVRTISAQFPEFAGNLERALHRGGRAFSFPSKSSQSDKPTERQNMRANFLEQFSQLSGPTKRTFEQVETARRGGSESELERAVRLAFHAMAMERRGAYGDPIETLFRNYPEQRLLWNAVGRRLSAGKITEEERALLKEYVTKGFSPGLSPNEGLGAMLFNEPVAATVQDLMLRWGAFRDVGVIIVPSPYTKVARVTSLPDAVFMTLNTQGRVVIPADESFEGRYLLAASNTVATRIEVSMEWAQDVQADVAYAVLAYLTQGLARRLDYAVFQGDGTDDTINGCQVGLYTDADIESNSAAAGNMGIPKLNRQDFINTIGAINPAALQRPCRWYINPAYLPGLMVLKDGPGNTYLLRSPAETRGDWELCSFPVTWAAGAPSADDPLADNPGKKVALFGEPNSYNVVLRQELELMLCDWADARYLRQVRALMRGRAQVGEQTGFATLTLAAQ